MKVLPYLSPWPTFDHYADYARPFWCSLIKWLISLGDAERNVGKMGRNKEETSVQST
jgi:hypothetical protein